MIDLPLASILPPGLLQREEIWKTGPDAFATSFTRQLLGGRGDGKGGDKGGDKGRGKGDGKGDGIGGATK